MQQPTKWLDHTPMTELGAFEAQIKALPSGVAFLNQVVQGLLVHSEWLAAYGIEVSSVGSISRTTLPVRERLGALVARDALELGKSRAPALREVGTCRDFALTLCSFLRAKGIPSRLRCGFASYLDAGWEDHWICQYWDAEKASWLLTDPQLDDVLRADCGVTFSTSEMPRDVFLTAGEAWMRCRTGHGEPDSFGHGSTKGIRFLKVNVIRDSFAMNNCETSAWDRWREVSPELRVVPANELPTLDWLAQNPESKPGELMPASLKSPQFPT